MAEQLSTEARQILESNLRFGRAVVLVLLLIIVILLVVALLVPTGQANPAAGELIRPIYIAELVAGLLVIVVRRLILSSWILGISRRGGRGRVVQTLLFLSLFGGTVAVTMALTALFVCWLTGESHHLLRLGGIGLLLALYSLPRRGEWSQALADL